MNPVDVIEENNRQRYLLRREAARHRGMTRAGNRAPMESQASGRSTVTRHPQTPWLLVIVAGSLGVLSLLAVVGAYTLIHEVFG